MTTAMAVAAASASDVTLEITTDATVSVTTAAAVTLEMKIARLPKILKKWIAQFIRSKYYGLPCYDTHASMYFPPSWGLAFVQHPNRASICALDCSTDDRVIQRSLELLRSSVSEDYYVALLRGNHLPELTALCVNPRLRCSRLVRLAAEWGTPEALRIVVHSPIAIDAYDFSAALSFAAAENNVPIVEQFLTWHPRGLHMIWEDAFMAFAMDTSALLYPHAHPHFADILTAENAMEYFTAGVAARLENPVLGDVVRTQLRCARSLMGYMGLLIGTERPVQELNVALNTFYELGFNEFGYLRVSPSLLSITIDQMWTGWRVETCDRVELCKYVTLLIDRAPPTGSLTPDDLEKAHEIALRLESVPLALAVARYTESLETLSTVLAKINHCDERADLLQFAIHLIKGAVGSDLITPDDVNLAHHIALEMESVPLAMALADYTKSPDTLAHLMWQWNDGYDDV